MRNSRHRWLWLAGAALLLALAALARGRAEKSALVHRVNLRAEGAGAAPPELALAMGLGVFRSFLVSAIWQRAGRLQHEKRFFELVELYDLIGKLQPHDGKVWAYAAWNMAYNISAEMPPGEDRWRWVSLGLDRIRKEGLRISPDERLLYLEMSWIYNHKIGNTLDDSHQLYKARLAAQMEDILGPGEVAVARLAAAVNEADSAQSSMARLAARRLAGELGMDIGTMAALELDRRLGPLDWRLPQAHAIYWAREGLRRPRGRVSDLQLERMVYQSMQALLQRGLLVLLPGPDGGPAQVHQWPDVRQVWPIRRMFLAQLETFASDPRQQEGVRSAFGQFLADAIGILVFAGKDTEAEKLFRDSHQYMPDAKDCGSAAEYFEVTARKRMVAMGPDQIGGLLSTMLWRHFWWLGRGDKVRAARFLAEARRLWEYNRKFHKVAERATNRAATFADCRRDTLRGFMARGAFHPEIEARLRATLEPGLLEPGPPESGQPVSGAAKNLEKK